jgi:hypothetical protein
MQSKDLFYRRNAEVIEGVSKFNNVEAFNLHMRKIYYTFKDEIDGSLKEFVKFLSRYSMRTLGVSWQKPETMAKNFGKSVVTIKRYISALKKLSIIDRVKPSKGAHFITYFTDTVELEELPSDTTDDTPEMIHLENGQTSTESKDEPEFIEQEAMTLKARSKSLSSKERYKGDVPSSNDTAGNDTLLIPNWVASEFVETVKPFLNANQVTKLWTKAAYAARKLGMIGQGMGPTEYTSIVIEAAKAAIYKYKRRSIQTTLDGYFYGIVYNMLEAEKAAEDRRATMAATLQLFDEMTSA